MVHTVAGVEKTTRLFNFLLWLIKSGDHGIATDTILEEYRISRKTLLRDLKELNKINDLISVSIDKESSRVYTEFYYTKKKPNTQKDDRQFNIFHQASFPGDDRFDVNVTHHSQLNLGKINITHQSLLSLSTHEFHHLINACMKANPVSFVYHHKERVILPLFFYYYGHRWYLVGVGSLDQRVRKFRLDKIESIKIQTYRKKPSFGVGFESEEARDASKRELLKRIEDSQNIFVDLNQSKKLKVTFRFYFSLEFIKKQIKHFKLIELDKVKDNQVNVIEIEFMGFAEARTFMNKWLGHFSILEPEWIIDQYASETEEAVDILRV